MSFDIKKGEPKFLNGPSSKLLAIPMNLTCSIPGLAILHIIRQYTKIKLSYPWPTKLAKTKRSILESRHKNVSEKKWYTADVKEYPHHSSSSESAKRQNIVNQYPEPMEMSSLLELHWKFTYLRYYERRGDPKICACPIALVDLHRLSLKYSVVNIHAMGWILPERTSSPTCPLLFNCFFIIKNMSFPQYTWNTNSVRSIVLNI
jgi:hypothetical protein